MDTHQGLCMSSESDSLDLHLRENEERKKAYLSFLCYLTFFFKDAQ